MTKDLAGRSCVLLGQGLLSAELPALVSGGDLRQKGAFVKDGVYFIPGPGICFLFGFLRTPCQD